MYKGGAFNFSFAINTNYPHDPPKVKCTQKVCLKRVYYLAYFGPDDVQPDLPPQR